MTDLVVRRLLIDLESPVQRHWCGGDAFRSAFFGALSMSFPIGEQFFIDSVRAGLKALPPEQQARFKDEAQGFIGQEATHRRIHALFNEQIQQHGLVNDWEPRARKRLALITSLDPRHGLAITAANEHFTALFAEWMLSHPECLDGAEPRLKTLWLWHSAEEAEHKCTAFDLYQALGGSEHWRLKWMRRVTVIFLFDTLRQTLNNLWRDGSWWRPSTWVSAWRLVAGRDGLLRRCFGAWRRYLQPDFHPAEADASAGQRWLQAHADLAPAVGAASSAPA